MLNNEILKLKNKIGKQEKILLLDNPINNKKPLSLIEKKVIFISTFLMLISLFVVFIELFKFNDNELTGITESKYTQNKTEEKKINDQNNPPNFKVEFFSEQKNIQNINCYSNEGDVWKKSLTKFNNEFLTIKFREPFKPRRGRINCSLNDNGKWRWFGTQFIVK